MAVRFRLPASGLARSPPDATTSDVPDWIHQLYTTEGTQHLIAIGGLALLAAIVFAETGLFVGFFLPGDSLLMTAGVCARVDPLHRDGPPLLSFWSLVAILFVAAVVGNCLNAWLGRVAGERIRQRPDGRLFKRRHLAEAEEFYRRYGGWAIVAGRFIPIVRTFVPFVAGMAGMGWAMFLLWTVVGGAAWVLSMCGLGYALAGNQTLVDHLHLLVLAIIAISFVPVGIGLIRRWRDGPAEAGSRKPEAGS
jgi:membrane-associated protein